MIKLLRAKLHGLTVTDCHLDYQGSITLDPIHCHSAGILPLEFVDIWNKNTGARLSTYVIFGEKGSNVCILNGAAARTCQKGDKLIIAASYYGNAQDLRQLQPRIAFFNHDNSIQSISKYSVNTENDQWHFSIQDVS